MLKQHFMTIKGFQGYLVYEIGYIYLNISNNDEKRLKKWQKRTNFQAKIPKFLAQKAFSSKKTRYDLILRYSKGFNQIPCKILLILDPRIIKIDAFLANLWNISFCGKWKVEAMQDQDHLRRHHETAEVSPTPGGNDCIFD